MCLYIYIYIWTFGGRIKVVMVNDGLESVKNEEFESCGNPRYLKKKESCGNKY